MSQAWAAVVQFVFFMLTLIPGIQGVLTWYILIGQAPVWLFVQAGLISELKGAVQIAMWVDIATVALALLQWSRCDNVLACTAAAARSGAIVAIALGMLLSNRHIINMVNLQSEDRGDEGDDDATDADNTDQKAKQQ